ncbi:F-box domain-containing protein [Aaosphaeria arxii CBS 175.79]|uniref:F-box domain-containing protein n=1 Tax=Aaosphaeria arxii CBS 175.79 TaxID=1450172 RepID=A0A6A5XJ44_9PLEO|nr:F-box domain-containing protein [Aaosphaeria arxii CBS 175.79]KAF2013152.1 F-box domain-containing protein [Aaosphaeria arxii CBS 175.79]
MAPGTLLQEDEYTDSRPSKKVKTDSEVAVDYPDDTEEDVATAVPTHPLDIKPAGNAYTASENLKSHCGAFAVLPDELINHMLESFDAGTLVRLGSTCKALYAFTRLDELWRALFIELSPADFEWQGTWRSTYLGIPKGEASSISCKNLFSDVLYRPFQCANTAIEPFAARIPAQNAITHIADLSPAEYAEKWTDKPFILTSPVKEWPIYNKWTPEYLLQEYPKKKFRAEAVDWPMETYMKYMSDSADESPLYLFDRAFVERTGINVGRDTPGAAYWPPDCFGDDLFDVLGEHRPDRRWMILGSKRSGSTFHKDPNATNAWNAILTGSKYWLMFPSSSSLPPPPGVILSEDQSEITSPLSIAEYLLTFHAFARQTPGCREGICYAGEVLHVPSGWFHLVLNLEDSLALTQNFVPQRKLAEVLGFLRDQRDQVSGFKEQDADRAYELFVEKLGEKYPDILAEGLQELEKKSKGGRGKWEELTKGEDDSADQGGFSFGFGGDDDDADIP